MCSRKFVFLPTVHKTVVQTMLKICTNDNLKTEGKYSITQTVVLRHLPQRHRFSMLSEWNKLHLQELWNNLSFWYLLGRKETILKTWVHVSVNGGFRFYGYLKANLKLKHPTFSNMRDLTVCIEICFNMKRHKKWSLIQLKASYLLLASVSHSSLGSRQFVI